MSVPALPVTADTRTITDRVNVLIRAHNRAAPAVVADLPAAASVMPGTRAFVTDATSSTFGAALAGGGANAVPVYATATGWRVG